MKSHNNTGISDSGGGKRCTTVPSLMRRRRGPSVPFGTLLKRGKYDTIKKYLEKDINGMDYESLQQWLYEPCVGQESPLHVLVQYEPPSSLVDLLAIKLTNLHYSSATSTMKSMLSNDGTESSFLTGVPSDESSSSIAFHRHHPLPKSKSKSRSRKSKLLTKAVFIPEEAIDDKRRTPLHVAAASGCHVNVISRLLEGATVAMPALMRDEMGRFPLHWACVYASTTLASKKPSWLGNKTTYEKAVQQCIHCIIHLINVYPQAIGIKDSLGHTPYALARSPQPADTSILKVLKKALRMHLTGLDPEKAARPDDSHDTTAASTALPLSEVSLSCCIESLPTVQDDEVSSLGQDEDRASPSNIFSKRGAVCSV